jgi:hypothetical protein
MYSKMFITSRPDDLSPFDIDLTYQYFEQPPSGAVVENSEWIDEIQDKKDD